MRDIKEIIVHCSATRPSWMDGAGIDAKREEIRKWHVNDRGWRDIGYHLLIDRDGATAQGRDYSATGAHVRGHNTGTIGICLIGGHGSSENDNFEDNFTPAQDAELRRQIDLLKDRFGIAKVSGHNEYAAKACPGFNVGRWMKGKPSARGSLLESTEIKAIGGVAVSGAGGIATALAKLDPTAQYIVLGFAGIALLGLGYLIARRRTRWNGGDR